MNGSLPSAAANITPAPFGRTVHQFAGVLISRLKRAAGTARRPRPRVSASLPSAQVHSSHVRYVTTAHPVAGARVTKPPNRNGRPMGPSSGKTSYPSQLVGIIRVHFVRRAPLYAGAIGTPELVLEIMVGSGRLKASDLKASAPVFPTPVACVKMVLPPAGGKTPTGRSSRQRRCAWCWLAAGVHTPAA